MAVQGNLIRDLTARWTGRIGPDLIVMILDKLIIRIWRIKSVICEI